MALTGGDECAMAFTVVFRCCFLSYHCNYCKRWDIYSSSVCTAMIIIAPLAIVDQDGFSKFTEVI